MMIIGIWSWIKSRTNILNQEHKNSACHYLPNGKLSLTNKCKGALLFAGMITGTLTGLLGVGGGFLIVPALIIAAKMPIKKAITTSLMIIFLVSTSGFIAHIQTTSIDWKVATFFIVGGILGMFGAMQLKSKINDSILQKIFAIMLIVLGFGMIVSHIY